MRFLSGNESSLTAAKAAAKACRRQRRGADVDEGAHRNSRPVKSCSSVEPLRSSVSIFGVRRFSKSSVSQTPGISRCCRSGFRWRGFPVSWCGIHPPPATPPAPPAVGRSWTRRPPVEERGRKLKHSCFCFLHFFKQGALERSCTLTILSR